MSGLRRIRIDVACSTTEAAVQGDMCHVLRKMGSHS